MKRVLVIIIIFFCLPQLSDAKVYLKVNKDEIIKGNQVKLYGYVKPRKKDVRVRIYRQRGGKWKYIKTKTTKKKGRFTYYTKPSSDTYYRAKQKKDRKWTWGSKRKFVNVRLYPRCGDDYTWFSANIMDDEDFGHITPLGAVNPTGHTFPTDHMYFYLNTPLEAKPVYAPGKIWIESISTSEHLYADPVFTDYSIAFRSCSKLHHFFLHVSGISDALQKAWDKGTENGECNEYTAGGDDYRLCSRTVRKKLQAGDLLGYAGGNANQGALDLGTYDTRKAITGVANENRWYAQVLYNTCSLDYYGDDIKNSLYALLGNGTVNRTVEPLCGDINQDVADTAQGRWFLVGTDESSWREDNQIALIHDEVNFDQGLFSIGDSTDSLSSGEYTFTPTDAGYVDRDFDQVTADGQIYCYDTSMEMILIQLTADDTLRVEGQGAGSCGSGPWSFGDDYTDFER